MEILENEPLREHTTMKVGGNAKIIYVPENEAEFLEAFARGTSPLILGGGSNIIAPDEGIKAPIILMTKMKKVALSYTEVSTRSLSLSKGRSFERPVEVPEIHCEAGATWTQVCNLAIENGLEGFENLNGLPGTIGGALFMNARCFGSDASDNLISVRYFDEEKNEIAEYKKNVSDWGYKISPFQITKIGKRKIILSAKFALKKSALAHEELKALYKKAIDGRNERGHYKAPSAGSVFKNNHNFGSPSGKIIDECGLKGEIIGGAKVAEWNANFIVNIGATHGESNATTPPATANDIRKLADRVKKVVKEKTGFLLEEEILFW